jgi:diguanylate cyclase (GGDEF)-like protein
LTENQAFTVAWRFSPMSARSETAWQPPEGRTQLSWLVGEHAGVRQGIKRLLWTLPSYAFAMVVLWVGVWADVVDLPDAQLVSLYSLFGLLLFYGLIRSGVSLHAKEPTLALPQVLFSITTVALSYVIIEVARPMALQWLCLILMFDMRRLTAQQSLAAAFFGLALTSAAVVVGHQLAWTNIDPMAEWINGSIAAVSVPVLLVAARTGYRLRQQMFRQREQLADTLIEVQRLSIRDGLTGAFNRAHAQGQLEEEARRQQRHRRPFCMALLDIDHFKRVNDDHGHAVGDAVLKAFVACIQQSVSQAHPLARWGGEEFLLLMPESDQDSALRVLTEVQQAVDSHDWGLVSPGLSVSFSAGVCQHDGISPLHATLERADQALYQAKAQGRHRVVAATLS